MDIANVDISGQTETHPDAVTDRILGSAEANRRRIAMQKTGITNPEVLRNQTRTNYINTRLAILELAQDGTLRPDMYTIIDDDELSLLGMWSVLARVTPVAEGLQIATEQRFGPLPLPGSAA